MSVGATLTLGRSAVATSQRGAGGGGLGTRWWRVPAYVHPSTCVGSHLVIVKLVPLPAFFLDPRHVMPSFRRPPLPHPDISGRSQIQPTRS